MVNAEIVEKINIIRAEIFNFFETNIRWVSIDEYMSFADAFRHAGCIVGKADYCGSKDTCYVQAQNGQRIWFENVIVKNGNNPVRNHRPRIEVLHALIDVEFQKTI